MWHQLQTTIHTHVHMVNLSWSTLFFTHLWFKLESVNITLRRGTYKMSWRATFGPRGLEFDTSGLKEKSHICCLLCAKLHYGFTVNKKCAIEPTGHMYFVMAWGQKCSRIPLMLLTIMLLTTSAGQCPQHRNRCPDLKQKSNRKGNKHRTGSAISLVNCLV